MRDGINKPIFVVGSPRSGTSIVTWCLGQHTNLFPVEESNWMGDFAVNVAIAYQVGAARGNRSVLSAMDIREDELFAAFGQCINDLILRHRKDRERKHQAGSTASEPKGRWVDGTPAYSLHICGLRKPLPSALFIHILRDLRAVVRSMLNFHRVAGTQLVPNEEKAYKWWLRSVRACVKAEQAYGPSVIYRIRYADLADNPEPAMRSLLDFLGESYTAKCLEPLAKRINSSNVPPGFKSDDPSTDPAVVKKATQLCTELENIPQPAQASCAVASEMQAAFEARVKHMATIDTAYKKAQRIINTLNPAALPLVVMTHAALAV